MASKTINTILNLKDNFSKTINRTSKNTSEFQRRIKLAENQAKRMKSAITGAFGSIAMKTGAIIGGIGIAEFAKNSVMLASDLQEVQNVVDTTFGTGSKQITAWSDKAIKAFGLGKLEAQQFNGTMGALLKSSGVTGNSLIKMSTDLSGLAGDMASFYNLDTTEAFNKIRSGISGETEPLKQLGINMSVANLQAFALTQGIKKQYKEMSQAEQVQLRYNYLMKVSKDSQGDFARTNKGFANQLRIAKTQLKQLGATLAGYALPGINKLLIKFNSLFDILPIGTSKFKTLFGFFKNNSGMQTLITKTQNAKKLFSDWFSTFKESNTFKYLMASATDLVNTFKSKWSETMKSLGVLVEGASKFWSDHGTNIIQTATDIFNIFKNITSITWDISNAAISSIGKALAGDWKGAFESLSGSTATTYKNLQNISDLFVKNGFLREVAATYFPAVIADPNSQKKILDKRANNGSIFDFIRNPNRDWGKFLLTGEMDKYPKNAIGTSYFRGGLTHVDERGGEIKEYPNGTKIIPHDLSEKIVKSSNKGVNVYVIIQGNVIGNEEYADYVGQRVADKVILVLDNM